MTEIKLTKRYPNSRTEDITDAYMRGWNDALDAVQNGKFHIADTPQTEAHCAFATNPSGDAVECSAWRNTYCEYQIYDLNDDDSINIVKCRRAYEQTDCGWK